MTQLYDRLKSFDACQSALNWIGERTAQQTWDECERADWLLWWLYKEHAYGSDGYRDTVRATVDCAETAVQYLKTDKRRSVVTAALDAARAWADEPTEERRKAATAAYATTAAYAAAYAATATAAYATTAAAAAAAAADAATYAADAAAYAAAYAATATYAATDAYAAYAAADADAARRTAHLKMCSLIRARIPLAPWKEVDDA